MPVVSIAAGGIPASMLQSLMAEKPAKVPSPQMALALDAGHYGCNLDVTEEPIFCSDHGVYL